MGLFVADLEGDCLPIELGVDQGQGNRVLRIDLPRVMLRVSVQEVEEDGAAQLPAVVPYR